MLAAAVVLAPGALADAIDQNLEAVDRGIETRPAGVLQREGVGLTGNGLELLEDRGAVREEVDRVFVELDELLAGGRSALPIQFVLEFDLLGGGLPAISGADEGGAITGQGPAVAFKVGVLNGGSTWGLPDQLAVGDLVVEGDGAIPVGIRREGPGAGITSGEGPLACLLYTSPSPRD